MPVSNAMSPMANVKFPNQSMRCLVPYAVVAQLQRGPHRAEEADRHRDQEHQAPFNRSEHTAQDQSDERAPDRGDAVDT